ncbi:MAG TPA: response regulator [Bryobacteraceae bacterium]|nr:response regulator [Bryobacteraceae bacterium]
MTNPIRVFLAEDNPADVYLIQEALRRHGLQFHLTVADDGEKALSILAGGGEYDLLLLDLNMPKRSGGEILEMLRGLSVPIVILTSSDSPSDRKMAARLGVTHYIQKPTELDDFLAIGGMIKAILGR